MLRIDRVATEMDVLPPPPPAPSRPSDPTAETLADPRLRERLRELVIEALRDHLRQLERQGVV